MCSPDVASITVIVVMAISGCCGVFVWIALFVGCTYLLHKWCKSRKNKQQPRQRRGRAKDYSDGAGYQHPYVPPRPPVPTAVLQPMPVMAPVYNQATLMTHPIQPTAGGNWIPSVDETNATLYRNRAIQQNISSSSVQHNPLYCADGESHSTATYTYGNATHTIHHHTSYTTSTGGHVISNHQELTSVNDERDEDVRSPPPEYNSLLQES